MPASRGLPPSIPRFPYRDPRQRELAAGPSGIAYDSSDLAAFIGVFAHGTGSIAHRETKVEFSVL
ncbi:hypothetical protein BGLA2_340015 [Burkholderia gladioli]|nr:hypothetical protein BGLA2_340015 [Burkholderia gladioli]